MCACLSRWRARRTTRTMGRSATHEKKPYIRIRAAEDKHEVGRRFGCLLVNQNQIKTVSIVFFFFFTCNHWSLHVSLQKCIRSAAVLSRTRVPCELEQCQWNELLRVSRQHPLVSSRSHGGCALTSQQQGPEGKAQRRRKRTDTHTASFILPSVSTSTATMLSVRIQVQSQSSLQVQELDGL